MKTLRTIILAAGLMSLMAATCKKSTGETNEPNPGGPPGGGPDLLLPNSGFLCTMGKDLDNHTDTLTYWFSTSGQEITIYGKGFQKPEDEIFIRTHGDNTISLERKGDYTHNGVTYKTFGIEENPNPSISIFPNNKYLFQFFLKVPDDKTHFKLKRNPDDKLKFTIESAVYPGYYLSTEKWSKATYALESRLVWKTTPREFFFMAN